ncbi:MAG: succinate dehydrogenase, hydrophobic membrane anchor protein [Alphaproteobacteria bacterium]|jgi:succinate dehydrogenase / fumarate reductase membrane anchor subunit|nr:succinate dehydrogenase, hydrophobic membrane anchor protein [Alphaproteobacteria bacterium]
MSSPAGSSFRTRLGRVRGLGSAKEGTAHWWGQRLSSLALVPLVLWFAISLVALAGAPHAVVVAWIRGTVTTVLLVVLIAAVFYHLALGLQVVVEDYVHTEWRKLAVVIAIKFASGLAALIGIFAVLRIAFGA